MAGYNPVERSIARLLERYPTLKSRIKRSYQKANFYLFRDYGFEVETHPDVTLKTIEEEFGANPLEGEVFFGYFDKNPWSPSGERGVVHRVETDSRDAEVIVLSEDDHEVVGKTQLWNYQQGAMAQWLPYSEDRVIYNCLIDGKYGSRIVTHEGIIERELQTPIQIIHPERSQALTLNYRRLADVRPDYGYSPPSNYFKSLSHDEDGIWLLDLETGVRELILDIQTLKTNQPRPEMEGAKHWVNHLLFSPSGDQFVFVHRWEASEGRHSRLYLCEFNDGDSLTLLMDDSIVSHYCWLDEQTMVVWGNQRSYGSGYYKLDLTTGATEPLGDKNLSNYGDGHPNILHHSNVMVTDTYSDRARKRYLLLHNLKTQQTIPIAKLFDPLTYFGEQRCDLHPRPSFNGQKLSIDSTHTGERKSYVVSILENPF
ncbi:hypothetical protein ACLI4Y_16625 [Natrialbaceae archaeon A-CW3]